jgi:hypothetical protein
MGLRIILEHGLFLTPLIEERFKSSTLTRLISSSAEHSLGTGKVESSILSSGSCIKVEIKGLREIAKENATWNYVMAKLVRR